MNPTTKSPSRKAEHTPYRKDDVELLRAILKEARYLGPARGKQGLYAVSFRGYGCTAYDTRELVDGVIGQMNLDSATKRAGGSGLGGRVQRPTTALRSRLPRRRVVGVRRYSAGLLMLDLSCGHKHTHGGYDCRKAPKTTGCAHCQALTRAKGKE